MIGGVELRKQRNLGDIVSDAFTILFAAFKPLAMIAIPIVVFNIRENGNLARVLAGEGKSTIVRNEV